MPGKSQRKSSRGKSTRSPPKAKQGASMGNNLWNTVRKSASKAATNIGKDKLKFASAATAGFLATRAGLAYRRSQKAHNEALKTNAERDAKRKSAGTFKHLMWALFGMPKELQDVPVPPELTRETALEQVKNAPGNIKQLAGSLVENAMQQGKKQAEKIKASTAEFNKKIPRSKKGGRKSARNMASLPGALAAYASAPAVIPDDSNDDDEKTLTFPSSLDSEVDV